MPFNFCETDYAVTPYVREFWNVASILGWVAFFCGCMYRRHFKGEKLLGFPHSISGSMQFLVTTIYYIDGIRIHAYTCDRVMTQELAVFLMMIPFFIEAESYLFPLAIVLPMIPNVLISMGLRLFPAGTSMMNSVVGLDFVPAFESLLSPVLVFIGTPIFVKLGLLPKNFQIALDRDQFLKWSMILMFVSQALGRYLEANGHCHLLPFKTNVPLIDEFFTPHNLFDHIPSYFDYQLAIFFDHLVYLQKTSALEKKNKKA
jgi:hypothetical protein